MNLENENLKQIIQKKQNSGKNLKNHMSVNKSVKTFIQIAKIYCTFFNKET